MTRELTNPGAELYCATCEAVFVAGELCPDDGTRLVRLSVPGDTLVGRDLDGRYTIGAKLGQGGMGAVYRARQHAMGREVAIKVVSPNLVKDAPTIKRFLREAKLASRLVHPNIVSVLDFGQTADGLFYLVMELVSGRTLHDLLAERGALGAERLVRIGSQICDALEGAHELPIIHRDLKPANIMVLATGRDLVKVLDFGLAKSLSPDTTPTTMTSAGALLGTPTFMPPEVATGSAVDHRADLYSLGCILYVIATGRPPFVSESIPELIAMHGTVPAPRTTGVPASIAQVIDRLLAKNPGDRYPTAAALRDALEEGLAIARDRYADADTFDRSPSVAIDKLTVESLPPMRSSDDSMTGVFTAATPPAGLPAMMGESQAVSVPRARRGPVIALVGAIAVTLVAIVLVLVTRAARGSDSSAPVIDRSPSNRASGIPEVDQPTVPGRSTVVPAATASGAPDGGAMDATALDRGATGPEAGDAGPIDVPDAATTLPAGPRRERPARKQPFRPSDEQPHDPPLDPPPPPDASVASPF
jgi:serine/threonine protein kinase